MKAPDDDRGTGDLSCPPIHRWLRSRLISRFIIDRISPWKMGVIFGRNMLDSMLSY